MDTYLAKLEQVASPDIARSLDRVLVCKMAHEVRAGGDFPAIPVKDEGRGNYQGVGGDAVCYRLAVAEYLGWATVPVVVLG